MTDAFPKNAEKYSETPLFTHVTLPAALRRNHQTKPGVWGKIVVEEGTLLYLRDNHPAQRVTSEDAAIIWPEELHFARPVDEVKFKVEFYRLRQQEVQ